MTCKAAAKSGYAKCRSARFTTVSSKMAFIACESSCDSHAAELRASHARLDSAARPGRVRAVAARRSPALLVVRVARRAGTHRLRRTRQRLAAAAHLTSRKRAVRG